MMFRSYQRASRSLTSSAYNFADWVAANGSENKSKGQRMKPQFNPAWLVSLMCRWSVRQMAGERNALGYPRKAAGFSEKTTGGYNHSNPVAFSAEDFRDLDKALEDLKVIRPQQFVAMMMYYKPWTVNAARAEGAPFGNSTYYQRLHAAHSFVATKLDAMKEFVE